MSTDSLTPPLVARGAAEDRYLRLANQARLWATVALALLAIDGVLSVAWVLRSFRANVVPYIVAVDSLGQVAAVRPAQPMLKPADALVRSQLALFIRNLRTIVPDAAAQKALLTEGYAFAQESAAQFLGNYYRANSPFTGLSEGRAVTVQINTVLPLSDSTWQVQWTEIQRRSGRDIATEHYQALLTIRISPPEFSDALEPNPLGLYIVSMSWTQIT